MKIALAQNRSFLGDFKKNKNLFLKDIKKATLGKASFILFPEAGIFGYPPSDFIFQKNIIKKQLVEIEALKKQIPKNLIVILGAFVPDKQGLKNVALVLRKNKSSLIFPKGHLAHENIFFEHRYFTSGNALNNYFVWKKKRIQILICEDLWKVRKLNSPDILFCLNASPYTEGRDLKRKNKLKSLVKKYNCPAVYINRVGGQDELIFDGASFFMDEKGVVKDQCHFFKPDFRIHNFTKQSREKISIPSLLDQKEEALLLGMKDFFSQVGIQKAHIGLSGGIDSALVAYLASKALGSKNIKAIFMPSLFTEKLSYKIAKDLARNLSLSFEEININKFYKEFSLFKKGKLNSITLQNIQARVRMLLLMAIGNEENRILLGTGNKSELACGYATLYGDLSGGLLPIGDLFKTEVYALSKNIQKKYSVFPKDIFTKPPSAELKKNQKDTDDLPDYKILDKILKDLLDYKPPKTKKEKAISELLLKSEFKRKQAPPILRITEQAFGEGRRFPIAHCFLS